MRLKKLLSLGRERLISVVGAGGKTTLIYRLAEELVNEGAQVCVTTTTKMFLPEGLPVVWFKGDYDNLIQDIKSISEAGSKVFVANRLLPNNKVEGLPPEVVDFLKKSIPDTYLLVEADGANQKPCKAPAPWEPVVPSATELVVVVMGLEVLGKELNKENCHRVEIIEKLTGLRTGETVNSEAIKRVLLSAEGYGEQRFLPARVVYLQKVSNNYTLFKF